MTVCPVCENPQEQGTVCDVCGKVFAPASTLAVAVESLPELEVTHHASGRANVVAERLAELEVSRYDKVEAVASEAVPELEPTRRVDSAPAAVVLPVDELERGREEDDGARTQAPSGAVPCRYCKYVQVSGLFCDRCGMRLPRVAGATAVASGPGADAGSVRCKACGARARANANCSDCGVFNPAPDA